MRFKNKIKDLYTTADRKPNATAITTPSLPLLPNPPKAPTSRSPSPQATTPQSPSSPPRCPSPQIISDRYIDDDKLLELCSQRFPSGSYRLSVRQPPAHKHVYINKQGHH